MLNENLTWNEVGAIATGPGTQVSDAFQLMFGAPTKELLATGTELCKFNGFSSLAAGPVTAATPLSPWWSPVASFEHDAGLVQRLKIAEANGVSMREWGRLTSVIEENLSSLDWLPTIMLAEPVVAWFGGFKGMARSDAGAPSRRNAALEGQGGSKGLPGGGTQVYIPNLTVAQISTHAFRPL